MKSEFRPFAGHLKEKEGSTPLRKRSKSDRELNNLATSSKAQFEWNQERSSTKLIPSSSLESSLDYGGNFSQEMTDRLEALSVLSQGSLADVSSRLLNMEQVVASDNSNDSFNIPSLPMYSAPRRQRSQVRPELQEERKVTILPPLVNPFVTESTSIHYPTQRTKQSKTTLWLEAYKDRPRFITDFEVEYMLGEGAFSTVFCVRNRYDGMLYALKRLKTQFDETDETKQSLAMREVCALAVLSSCPQIIRYYGSWLEEGYLYIQTELCLQKSFDVFVKSPLPSFVSACPAMGVSEQLVWRFLQSVAAALKFMHGRGLVHLDIRPANVLIAASNFSVQPTPGTNVVINHGGEDSRSNLSSYSSGNGDVSFTPNQDDIEIYPSDIESSVVNGQWTLRLADFGLCRLASDTRGLEEGETRYCAPELIDGTRSLDLTKCDVFSLGASAYELCKGERLGFGEDAAGEWHRIRYLALS